MKEKDVLEIIGEIKDCFSIDGGCECCGSWLECDNEELKKVLMRHFNFTITDEANP